MSKEMQIRRRIGNIYNKRQEHFGSLREYNDYLEEVEDIIFNLVEGIDVAETEARIKAYHEKNQDQILASRARRAVEIGEALQQERGGPESRTDQNAQSSDQPLAGGLYAPTVAPGMQPRQPEPVNLNSDLPPEEDEETRRLREERAAFAGGWSMEFCRKRAYQEAFGSIWVN